MAFGFGIPHCERSTVPLHVPLHVSRALLVAVLFPLAACATANRKGLEPLVTDRPDFTESSETVPTGLAQLESGTTFARDGDVRGTSIGEALLRVGVSSRAEVRLGFNSYSIQNEAGATARGLEDASLGAKFKLLQGGPAGSAKPTVALLVWTSLPTGATPFRAQKLQPEMKTAFAWDLNDRVAFSSNLNYAWVRETFDSYGEVGASGSLGLGVTDRVGAYVEYFGFFPRAEFVGKSHFANGGVTFGLNDNLQLDARAGKQVARKDGTGYFIGLGISRRW